MGQALYRKYRSKSFSEVVGQKHVTDTLENAIKHGRISHAYLFTGPRGIGKTSVARILAHVVNDLPYDETVVHLDIIEIDAASNRRIDEIRDLRDKVHISPASAKYKVYIIDEVHMLTREAFNALLKTLEEPPAHCIFILATTEAHKLPETILSRTQRFEFKPVGIKAAADHLDEIAKKEKIDIDREALEMLAEYGYGSFRDSISLLDQLSSTDQKVTSKVVSDMLGLPPQSVINDLAAAIGKSHSAQAIKLLDQLKEQGVNAPVIAKNLSRVLREDLIAGKSNAQTSDLLKRLIEVPASASPQDSLEIAIIQACQGSSPLASNTDVKPAAPPKVSYQESEIQTPKISVPATLSTNFSLGQWDDVVDKIKTEAASLYTALRLASPEILDNKLVLSFQFPLHQKKVSSAQNKDLICRTIEEISGSSIELECVIRRLSPKQDKPVEQIEQKTSATISTISNIFGQSEVLES
jgi:DNA polymerase-3 subunit gamma/tau